MTKLHFIGGEKGGVGKSLVARVLAQYFIDHKIPFIGFDTDRSHGALLRFYSEFASPVVIDRYESLDSIVEAAAESPERRVLVDLAAQTYQFLIRWIEDSSLLDISAELDLSVTYWHVMDTGRDSVDLLRKLLDQFGSRIDLVVVLNEIRGESFDVFESSGERARAENLGAKIIRIRKLQETTMQKIDARSISFWSAINSPDKAATGLGLLERQRVRTWLVKAYSEIGPLGV